MSANASNHEAGSNPAIRPAATGALPPMVKQPVAVRVLFPLCAITVILHLAIAGNYGWFRDELYYIDAGKHLAGGYVEFPVMVALLTNLQRTLFGTSIAAMHVLPAFAGAAIIAVTGLMARELGGGRTAQGIAALAALAAPAFIGADALFTMDAFDELWCTLAAYLLIRILSLRASMEHTSGTNDMSRIVLWLLVGIVVGIGLLTKLTILAYVLAMVVGLLATSARSELRSPWPYVAALTASAFLLPYLIWQTGHDWATLTFWHNYHHTQDTVTFVAQVILLIQPLALPLWAAGLWYLLRRPDGARYRAFGWSFLVLLALFLVGHAKSYFLVPAFPPLLAAGAVALEQRVSRRSNKMLVRVTIGALILGGVLLAPIIAPVLPARTLASIMPSPVQPVADRFGWPQLMQTVSSVYRSLPARDRAHATILAGNYGEAGAFDLLGPSYNLPRAISPNNTYYFWGHGVTPGSVVIATDYQPADLAPYFRSVRDAAVVPAQDGISNEEVGRHVYVCRGLKLPWPVVWSQLKNFS